MTKQELQQLANEIIAYRAKHNIGAVKFAELCRVTPQTMYSIENCTQSPSKLTLAKITEVLNSDKD